MILTGLTLFSEEHDFVILETPNSPAGSETHTSNFDDETITTIAEDDEAKANPPLRTRQNSNPTPFSAFKTALLNGT
jgi:hypothetical protein